MNPTAYAVLAELVVIRDIKHRESMTAPEYDEFCARYDAAYAAARACVARGDVREPTVMGLCAINHLVLHPDQPYIFRKMRGCAACQEYLDAAPKENAK